MRPWRFVRNAFLPHRDNRRHPHLLRQGVVGTVLAVIIFIELASLLQSFTISRSTEELSAVLPAVIIALTDQQREENELGGLTTNPLLTQAAQDAADDMAAKGYFSHVSPSGVTPWDWLNEVGYEYQFAGQNLAVNFSDSQQLVDAWMNSPEHRANILGVNYTQIGVGMATGTYQGQQVTFVVQFFASPQQIAVVPPTVSETVAVATTTPVSIPGAPTVAAAETHQGGASVASAAQRSSPPLSLWTRILASPRTYATEALSLIVVLFAFLLVLGFIPFTEHLLHPKAAFNAAALVVIILGILVLNKEGLLKGVALPTDTQSASVILYHSGK